MKNKRIYSIFRNEKRILLKHDTKNLIVELEESFPNIQTITCASKKFHINYLEHINLEYIIFVSPKFIIKIHHCLKRYLV